MGTSVSQFSHNVIAKIVVIQAIMVGYMTTLSYVVLQSCIYLQVNLTRRHVLKNVK